MQIFIHLLQSYRWQLVGACVLTLLFGIAGVGLLMFINSQLLTLQQYDASVLLLFIALLLAFLALSIVSQFVLTALGHHFVYLMRQRLIKQILDAEVEHIRHLGKSRLLASLSADIKEVSFAFVRLPELLQGFIFVSCAAAYMAYLSFPLFIVSAIWIMFTLWVSHRSIAHVFQELHHIRTKEDDLHKDYQAVIDGQRELKLNRDRAQQYFEQEFLPHSLQQKKHYIRADFFHFFANNWTNVMLLGAVGLNFYLALAYQWGDLPTAVTLALTILFLRTPLVSAIAAVPSILAGQVALRKLTDLQLPDYQEGFESSQDSYSQWQTIRFEEVCYRYGETEQDFALSPVNFTLRRGELVFLIGKNGSGKSTLSMLLAGLCYPTSGKIYIDEKAIDLNQWDEYRQQISAVFSDFYLFSRILGQEGKEVAASFIQEWLTRLKLEHKVHVVEQQLSTIHLSQGQRKRLALMLALAEQRSLLILDEWAADQDPAFRHVFYREILPLLKARGITVFAISHDDSYFDCADRLLLIQQGFLRELIGQEREYLSHDVVEKI